MSRPKIVWPDADREMFETLFTPGGPLEPRGPLAHVRSTTRKSLAGRYAQWLSWLSRATPDALQSPPVERSAMARMTNWLNDREDLAPMSRLALFDAVLRVLSAAHPHLDWSDHKALRARLRRAAGHGTQARKRGRILSSRVLLDAGRQVSETAEALPAGRMARAISLRDGAMIALLVLLPMRRHALAGLQIGPSVFVSETRITIALPELLVKSGRPWETEVPEPCLSVLRRYLDDGRPVLAARGAGDDPHLWLDRSGRELSYDYIGPRIASVTERVLGKRIPPHFFRDAAATTLARMSPESTKLIRPILGHSSDRTAERHYNHARSIEAGRSYAALVAHLKETSR